MAKALEDYLYDYSIYWNDEILAIFYSNDPPPAVGSHYDLRDLLPDKEAESRFRVTKVLKFPKLTESNAPPSQMYIHITVEKLPENE